MEIVRVDYTGTAVPYQTYDQKDESLLSTAVRSEEHTSELQSH